MRALGRWISAGLGVLSLLMAALFLLSIFLTVNGYTEAYLGSPPETIAVRVRALPLYLGPLPVYLPIGWFAPVGLSELMTALLAIYTLCLFKTFVDGGCSLLGVLRLRCMVDGNSFSALTSYTSATLVAVVVIQQLQERVGVKTGSLAYKNELLKYISVALAPLIEEVGFRALLIGLAILAIVVGALGPGTIGAAGAVRLIVYPWTGREAVVERYGRDALRVPAAALIAASSLIFGTVHYLYGAGWQVGKVTTATLAGLTLGYVYYRYGLPASIMSHYVFNHFLLTYHYVGGALEAFADLTLFVQGLVALAYLMARAARMA